jgi:hypothetical protein
MVLRAIMKIERTDSMNMIMARMEKMYFVWRRNRSSIRTNQRAPKIPKE